jgi:hypothetical protein
MHTEIRPARGRVVVLLVLIATATLLWNKRDAVAGFAAELVPTKRDMKRYHKQTAQRRKAAAKERKAELKRRKDYQGKPLARAQANNTLASLTLAGAPSRNKN